MANLKKTTKEKINKTEKTKKKEIKEAEEKIVSPSLISRVTEKASFLNEKGVYVFNVEPCFNKIMVKQAIKKQYGVEPKKVRIMNIAGKMVYIKRRPAQKEGYKKAMVYLKKGDKITT